MALVDSDFAQWLRSEALYSKASNVSAPAGLLTGAPEGEIISALANVADADSENARQMSFLGLPLAIDEHIVKGAQKDLIGKPITLTASYLEYDAGVTVFVIGVEENEDNTSTLTVLKRLT